MYSRARFGSLGLFLTVLLLSPASTTLAATISTITYLGLSSGNFQEPPNVAPEASIKHMPLTNPVAQGARGVRSDRDLAQTFTVSATDFPTGLDVVGFAIFYEGGPATALGTFNVELFPVANATASSLADSSSVAGSLLVSGTGLNFETSFAEGTAIFNFDSTVHLDPGAYAWRFVVPGSDLTNLFAWGPTSTSNPYAGGIKYEGDANVAAQNAGSGDFYFGVIPVPEPASYVLSVIALASVSVVLGNRGNRFISRR